jgi:hypothetical protein
MCFLKTPKVSAAAVPIASGDNTEAIRQADMEARLRRRRSGAAANILTGPMGIPSGENTPTLGGTA